jgi:hypothetical protein
MELLIILVLILLGIIIPVKIFKPMFILLSAAATLLETVTLPYVAQISGETIIYSTLNPLYQWALGLILLTTAVILYIDSIDTKRGEDDY